MLRRTAITEINDRVVIPLNTSPSQKGEPAGCFPSDQDTKPRRAVYETVGPRAARGWRGSASQERKGAEGF